MQTANRVAFNTLVHYIQLVLNVVLGLISVRLILRALGKVDYGVYDVVGGVVGLLSFVSASLSQASMRFISVSLGKKDLDDLRRSFSICLWLHLSVATILIVIVEIVGLFLFNGFLNIPTNRIHAAKIIFQCVSFTLFLSIIVTPYKALINSHEKFWFTSIIGIINSVFKLIIAIVITFWFSDKLIAYGVLLSMVTALDFILIVWYVSFLYRDQVSYTIPSLYDLKEMTGFVGWTMMDVLGSVLNRQGYAVMLNRFFGPIVNTTFGLSRQLEGHMYSVSSSAVSTMKPQIMKSYGQGLVDRMFRLSMTAGKLGFALMSVITVPLIIMMPEILDLWLGNYPEDTVLFARLMVLACMAEQLTRGLVFANQAVGNIKMFSIIVSFIRIMALPISWVLLLFGFPAYVAIIVFLVCEVLGSFSRVIILSYISDFKRKEFYRQVVFKIIPPVLAAFVMCWSVFHCLSGYWGMFIAFIVTSICYALMVYRFGLTKEEKRSILGIINSLLGKVIRS